MKTIEQIVEDIERFAKKDNWPCGMVDLVVSWARLAYTVGQRDQARGYTERLTEASDRLLGGRKARKDGDR